MQHAQPAHRALGPDLVPILDIDHALTLPHLLAHPDLIPTHFPADRHGPPHLSFDEQEFARHPAGTVSEYDGATSARCPEVAFNVLRSYHVLLPAIGLMVDHHGWLFANRTERCPGPPARSSLERVMPRVLRCLSLLQLQGYSSSGYRCEYSYAASLATKLTEVLALRQTRSDLAAECSAILAER